MRLPIILNPASGPDRPVLRIFNDVFSPAGVEWEIYLTRRAGDAYRFACQLRDGGAEVIAVYGGDGTVKEAARALAGTPILLGILPGGTGNALATELGVPRPLAEAAHLLCRAPHAIRAVDMGQIGEAQFILRASMGLETVILQSTDRFLKDRFGPLAYPLIALQRLQHAPFTRYSITVDGQTRAVTGIQCTIANSAQMGVGGLALAQGVRVDDGLLDVIVLTQVDMAALVEIAASNWTRADLGLEVQHWQGREIEVSADPPQMVAVGADPIGPTPVRARVWPGALRIIVP